MRAVVVVRLMMLGTCMAGPQVWATPAPADPCSLLSAVQVSKTMGGSYGAPEKSVAPRPFANTAQGVDCQFKTAREHDQVLFRVYFDASPAQATDLHARLKRFYGADSTSAAVGDEAYIDSNGAIHVRKGNVRYFLSISQGGTPSGRAQLLALAGLVSAEL